MRKKLFENQTIAYFVKAILLVVCLMLVSWVAPHMPSVLLPLFFIAYAAISTIGALYYTVINRLHRQKKLADAGNLSKLNRKWVWRMVGILIASLVSGFFFVLESPKWDALEWVLICVSVPLYYAVFLITQHCLKKEYAPRFYKAHAMRWSFWMVGILLCIAYAALSSLLPAPEYSSLSAAFQAAYEPYECAPSAVMNIADEFSSFADGLVIYGTSRVSDWLAILGFILKIVAYASVFFGLVSQFSSCLLNATEIKSEFQILPPHDEDESSGPILPQYLIAFAVVAVVAYGAYLCFEFELAKLQATGEYSKINALIAEKKERLIYMVDGAYENEKEQREIREDAARRISDLAMRRDDELTPLINDYYDRCLNNIDSYLDWYYEPAGTFARFMKSLGNPMAGVAKDTFIQRITEGTDGAAIEKKYSEYQEEFSDLRAEIIATVPADDLVILLESQSASEENSDSEGTINFWVPLEDPAGALNVNDVLLSDDDDREALKEKISNLIKQARDCALLYLGVG